MEDITVWRTAHHLIKRYGDDAAARAARQAQERRARGDAEGALRWQRVGAAVAELEREKIDENGPHSN